MKKDELKSIVARIALERQPAYEALAEGYRNIIFLTEEDIHTIHETLIEAFGGKKDILDKSKIGSAVQAVKMATYYQNLEIIEAAACYLFYICQSHAFADGNKRVAASAMEVFLNLNGYRLRVENNSLARLVINIAKGGLEVIDIMQHLDAWAIKD